MGKVDFIIGFLHKMQFEIFLFFLFLFRNIMRLDFMVCYVNKIMIASKRKTRFRVTCNAIEFHIYSTMGTGSQV